MILVLYVHNKNHYPYRTVLVLGFCVNSGKESGEGGQDSFLKQFFSYLYI